MFNRIVTALVSLAAAGTLYAIPVAYVSVGGSDLNPCSLSAPCRSFNAALAVIDNGGTITALDRGDFTTGGTVTIHTAVTIDGGPGATLTGPSAGPVFLVGPNVSNYTIILRNMTIVPAFAQGSSGISGSAINGTIRLENVRFDMPFTNNNVTAIAVIGGSGTIFLSNVTVNMGAALAAAGQEGVIFSQPSPPATSFRVIADRLTVRGGDTCLSIQDGSLTMHDSAFEHCHIAINLTAPNAPGVRIVESTRITNNDTGIQASAGTLYLSNSVLTLNQTALSTSGSASVISLRNNVFAGNVVDNNPVLGTSYK